MPDGASSCGPNVTAAAGHQSFELSRTTRSLASRSAVNSCTSVRTGIQSASAVSAGTSNAGSPFTSTAAFAASSTPSASCARLTLRRKISTMASLLARICADRSSFSRLPTPPSRRLVL